MDSSTKLRHLGVIADGNRRWAAERGLPKIEGHKRGLEVIEELVAVAARTEIEYLTFYVFSTENWGREADEVGYIMRLAEGRILKFAEKMAANNIRMVILGAKEGVPEGLSKAIEKAEKMTEGADGLVVCFCFNYGGEREIAEAARKIVGEITPEAIRANLYHPEVPDVDMVVRTSGEERISGFMLWRVAYAEFLFMEKYFPEMCAEDIAKIIAEFEKRQRRFGK